jgi:hypothetical protein
MEIRELVKKVTKGINNVYAQVIMFFISKGKYDSTKNFNV